MIELRPLLERGGGSYFASTEGDIWSNKSGELKKLKACLNSDGYLVLNIYENGVRKSCRVHQLVCEAFHGPKPFEDAEVCHGVGSERTNNRPENLRWGSRDENQKQRDIDGTAAQGENNPKAKLTWPIVREIRKRYRADIKGLKARRAMGLPTIRELAKEYEVSHETIAFLVRGATWKE